MEKPKIPVSATEEDQVTRKLLIWLNSYPDLPVDMIRFEFLAADTEGMALSTIQAGYIQSNISLADIRQSCNSRSFTG